VGPEEISNACAKTACIRMMDIGFAVIYSGIQIQVLFKNSKS
jgi:hypothetical protein